MKLIKYVLPLLSVILFSSCGTVTSDSAYLKETDFSKLKVYTIYPSTALKGSSPVLAATIAAEIDSVMQKKGFIRGNEVHDFVVTFYTETEVETSYGSVNFERWKGFWSTKEEPLFAVKGLIVIDMIDAGTGQVIWRGWDSKFVGKEQNPRDILKSTISGILSLYPPQ